VPDLALEKYSYIPIEGSTPTGLSDAFQSFWYFGCLKFFLIALVMQKLWLAARHGSLTAQLLYMLMPVQAMQAITHTTHSFVAPWIHMAIFLLPALLLAHRRRVGQLFPSEPLAVSRDLRPRTDQASEPRGFRSADVASPPLAR
jgi:hypothetical protein